jgi:large subunit ribosomal protein L15
MRLDDLRPNPGARTAPKRLGRGIGSGLGKTSGKGHKGQNARAGGGVRPGFEGGQLPLQRRLPKRGFRNPEHAVFTLLNLERLEDVPAGTVVNPEYLLREGILRRIDGRVKVLGRGELTQAITVQAHAFSQAAKEKIEALGGKAEVL